MRAGYRTPRARVAAECARRGKEALVSDCIALVHGETEDPDVLRGLTDLVGLAADRFFDGRQHQDTYWFRVWALRGLMWCWDDIAVDAVLVGLRDDHWRVREMAAKVVARHLVVEALESVAQLRDDPVPRVRAVGERALIRLSEVDA